MRRFAAVAVIRLMVEGPRFAGTYARTCFRLAGSVLWAQGKTLRASSWKHHRDDSIVGRCISNLCFRSPETAKDFHGREDSASLSPAFSVRR